MNKKYIIILLSFVLSIFFNRLFSQELNFDWAKQFGSENQANYITSLASDNEDLIFAYTDFENEITIAENTYLSHGGSDLLLFAIDENGENIWSITEGGPDNEVAQEIQCDADGNVYIIGKFNNSLVLNGSEYLSNGAWDMFIAKYSNSGGFIWCKVFGGPNSEALVSMKIKYNRIIVAGRFYDYTCINNDTIFSHDGTDVFLAKFDLDGELLNTKDIGGQGVDMVSDLSLDVEGNIYIVGDFYQDIYFNDISFDAGEGLGVYLAKFNSSLDLSWAQQIIGDDLKPDVKLSVTPLGMVSIAGNFTSSVYFGNQQLTTLDFDEDIYLANFDSDGVLNWAQRFFSNSMETVLGLSVDAVGNIYISGHYLDHIHFAETTIQYNLCCGEPEIFMVKLLQNGDVENAQQLTGERSGLQAMVVPDINQVFLGGYFSDEISFGEFVLNSPTSYNIFITYIKDDTYLPISENTLNRINVSPNPSDDIFFINGLGTFKKLKVINENGFIISEENIEDSSIYLGENWPTGLYLVQLIQENGKYITKKLIKL